MTFRTIISFVSVLFGFLFCTGENAYAWGAGIHIAQGEFVLNNLVLVLPHIGQLLRAFPIDFLYGCIGADIFIGKGSNKRDDHCHNWSVGLKMLGEAEAPFEKAFTYGYLSHLAADTIAHNFFIPNQLYRTSSTRRIGHVYWECRSDSFSKSEIWKLAKDIISRHDPRDDYMIERMVRHRVLSFKAKKQIYIGTIRLNDLARWQQTVAMVSRNSRWELRKEYVDFLKQLSFAVTVDFLRNLEKARCLKYDPVGTDSIREAKRRRRLMRRINGKFPEDMGFAIPEELLETVELIKVDSHAPTLRENEKPLRVSASPRE